MIFREKPMSKVSIFKAYFGAILLTAIIAIAAWWQGDNATTIFHKTLVAPLYLLASTGLRSFFPETLDSKRGILGTVEFHLLNSAILAAFFILVLRPFPDDVGNQLISFFFFTAFTGTANFAMAMHARKKNQDRDQTSPHLTDL